MRKAVIAFSTVFAILGAIVALVWLTHARREAHRPQASFPASFPCATAGTGEDVVQGLVVGESWAAYGYLLPSLPQTFADRSHRHVRVCTLGFSGANSAQVASVLRAHHGQWRGAFGGRDPDFVIVLNGVNDQVQHIGPSRHAADTTNIVSEFPQSDVYVASTPYIGFKTELLPWSQRLRYRLNDFVNDGGHPDVTLPYRAAMKRVATWHVIDYSAFLPRFEAADYTPDGAHLTRAWFARYGSFLANQVIVRP